LKKAAQKLLFAGAGSFERLWSTLKKKSFLLYRRPGSFSSEKAAFAFLALGNVL
jgi:hypothetical protein